MTKPEAADAEHAGMLMQAVGNQLVTEQFGAVALFLGGVWGLYVVGVGMMASFVFMISGAWLLLVGVESIQPQESGRAQTG